MSTVRETIEKVANEICDHYCKMPEEFNKTHEGNYDDDNNLEVFYEEYCSKCPLNQL